MRSRIRIIYVGITYIINFWEFLKCYEKQTIIPFLNDLILYEYLDDVQFPSISDRIAEDLKHHAHFKM